MTRSLPGRSALTGFRLCRTPFAISQMAQVPAGRGEGMTPKGGIGGRETRDGRWQCHGLYHRGTIKAESIYVYKSMLVAIARAFDVEAIDRLLFLESCKKDFLVVSGDGLLHFGRLIAGGLASVNQKSNNNWQIVTYAVNISPKGRQLIEAWKQGDRTRLRKVMGGPVLGGRA